MAVAAAACALGGSAAAALLLVAGSHRAGAASGQPTIPSGLSSSLRDAQLLSDTSGWALTDTELELTTDSGTTWRDMTPPGVDPSTIRAVFFSDASHGWVLTTRMTGSNDQPLGQLVVYRTDDGGTTWTSSDVGAPTAENADATAAPASFDFLSNDVGWLSVTLPSGGAFSRGLLFKTQDGGVTWTALTMPIGAPVAFATPLDGWTAGGPGGASAFVTHDGGVSWQALSLPAPAGVTGRAVYGIPAPAAGPADAISATYSGGTVVFFETADDGQSFAPSAPVETGETFDGGAGVDSGQVDSGQTGATVASVVPAAGHADVVWLAQRSTPDVLAAAGIPSAPSESATHVSVVSSTRAWAVLTGEACASKTACASYSGLFSTSDSGSDWTQLHP